MVFFKNTGSTAATGLSRWIFRQSGHRAYRSSGFQAASEAEGVEMRVAAPGAQMHRLDPGRKATISPKPGASGRAENRPWTIARLHRTVRPPIEGFAAGRGHEAFQHQLPRCLAVR